MFIYDICFHLEDYTEKNAIEFSNPVSAGDYISDGDGEARYEVFEVAHSLVGGGSCIHVQYPAPNLSFGA